MTQSARPLSVEARAIRHPMGLRSIIIVVLVLALLATMMIAATIGAAGIPLPRLAAALGLGDGDATLIARDRLVLWSIRLPRIALAAIVGALLAAAGTVMQGLFRNPLADPALVGISAGAGLATAATIVIGDKGLPMLGAGLPFEAVPFAAFLGALAVTVALYRIGTRDGRTSIATLLLAGLAINALANAGVGLLIFLADDRQLRDITFWTLGSLSGATWAKATTIAAFLVLVALACPVIARKLDLLALGEAEAFHMGVEIQRLKRWSIVLAALAVGAAVSVAGVIAFVGIVVPHLLRLVIGPGHRLLLPAALLLGAILLLIADSFARVVVAPAELPIGIVTAAIGAPFFLMLLLRQRSVLGL